jgi:hypothetical protein
VGVKRPGREADHSPPSSAEVKEFVELYLHSSNMPSRRGAQLKHRDNFTITFRRQGGLQNGSGTGGEEKNSLSLPGIESLPSGSP